MKEVDLPEFPGKMHLSHLQCLIRELSEESRPLIIIYCLKQCRQRIRIGDRWAAFGTTEEDLLDLLERAQIYRLMRVDKVNYAKRRIQYIVSQNVGHCLNRQDAHKLCELVRFVKNHGLDWRDIGYTKESLLIMINLARSGYSHLPRKTTAA